MFESLEMAPPDPILGLTEAFKSDPNPKKVNLGVGVYKNESGQTPIFSAVKKAEQRILQAESSKSYLPIPGGPEYAAAVQELLFGPDHNITTARRAVTAQTPGGTGALRVAGDLLKKIRPDASLWISDPTWANHKGIFGDAGHSINTYPYYDAPNKSLAFDRMAETLNTIPTGDIVLLHACCHNPTGVDPSPDQWQEIAKIVKQRGLLPIVDFAYQGFGKGLEEDAVGLRCLCKSVPELFIASSFSKNFGLYNERIASLTAVCADADSVQKLFSHLKITIRRNYSNPPAHGSAIITTILNDPQLRSEWESELKLVCGRIQEMRRLLVDTLKKKGVTTDFSFITEQNGMFSFSGLTKDHVDALRERYSVYIVGSGRINVAGITPGNIDYLCDAIADVLK